MATRESNAHYWFVNLTPPPSCGVLKPVMTAVFIFVSDRVASATAEITTWICGSKQVETLPTVAMSTALASRSDAMIILAEGITDPAQIRGALTLMNAEAPMPRQPTRAAKHLSAVGVSDSATFSVRFGMKSKLAVGLLAMWALNLMWYS
jgi:hypothetical protein